MQNKLFASIGFIATIAILSMCGVQAANTTLSASAAQQIKGWGFFPSTWDGQYGTELVNYPNGTSLLGQMGATWYRMSVNGNTGNSDGTLSVTWMSGLKHEIGAMSNVGMNQYVLNTWSPPPFMKLPDQTTHGTSSSGATEYLNPSYESSYVSYWIAVLNDLKSSTASGSAVALPTYISIQNESNFNAPSWDGCDYDINPTQQALYRQVVKDLRIALNNNGYSSIGILGAESEDPPGDLDILGSGFSQLGSDSTLNAALAGVAFHSYDQEYINQVEADASNYGKDVWELEWSPAVYPESNGNEWDLTVTIFRHLGADLVTGGTNYWFWWDGVNNGAANTSANQALFWNNTDSGFHFADWYYVFKNLWTNVRPGWYLEPFSSCDDSTFTINNTAALASNPSTSPLAVDLYGFENSAHTQNVVLMVNPSTSSSKSVVVNGIVGTSGTIYTSKSTQNQVASSVSVSSGQATFQLPAYSVSLFVSGIATTGSAPAAPSNLTASAGSSLVSLSWTASSGATSYSIFRGTVSGAENGTALAIGVNGTNFTDTGLSNGTKYYYKVCASNTYGTSAASNEASATPSSASQNGAPVIAGGSTTSTGSNANYIANSYNGVISNEGSYQCFCMQNVGDTVTYTLTAASQVSGLDMATAFSPACQVKVEYQINGTWTTISSAASVGGTPGSFVHTDLGTMTGVTAVRLTALSSWVYIDELKFDQYLGTGGNAIPTISSGSTTSTGSNSNYIANSYDGVISNMGSYQCFCMQNVGDTVTYTLSSASQVSGLDMATAFSSSCQVKVEYLISGSWVTISPSSNVGGTPGSFVHTALTTETGVTAVRLTAISSWIYIDEVKFDQ